KSLLDKKLAAGMATDMERRQQGERFTMLDAARIPEKPIRPKRPFLYAIACGMSIALALAFAIVKETKKNTILGEWELPSGVTVLGRVPFIAPVSEDPIEPRNRKWALVSSFAFSLIYWGRR